MGSEGGRFCPPWSFQIFYGILRNERRTPASVLEEWLRDFGPAMLDGFSSQQFQKAKVEAEKATLKSEAGVDEETLKFVERLAQRLNVSLETAYGSLTSYLLNEYLGGERDLSALLKSEQKLSQLITEVEKFFRSEQIFAVKCLSSLFEVLRTRDEQNDVQTKLLQRFVETKITGKDYVKQMKKTLETFASGSCYGNRITPAHALHSLRIQLEIYKSLLWHLHLFEYKSADIELVFEIISQNDLGRKQPLRRLLAVDQISMGEEMVSSIGNLLMLAVIQIMEIDVSLYTFRNSGGGDLPRSRWIDSENYTQLEVHLKTLANFDCALGPIFLAWSVLMELRRRQTGDNDEDTERKLMKLGELAKEANAICALKAIQTSAVIQGNPELQHLSASLLYSVFDGFLEFFDLEAVFSTESAVDFLVECFRFETVSEEFWGAGFKSGAALFTRDILYRFPCFYNESLRLLQALASSSDKSCRDVVVFVQRLPCYTESLDSISAAELVDSGSDSDGVFELIKDRLPYGEDPQGIPIPRGTKGRMITAMDNSEGYMQWELAYNGWLVVLIELRRNIAYGSDKAKSTLSLVDELLAKVPSLVEQFVHFLNISLDAIKDFDDSLVPTEVDSLCLSCIASAAKVFPTEVLDRLSSAGFLPSFNSLESNNEQVKDLRILPGIVGRIIIGKEAAEQSHSLTVAFLKLIFNVIESGNSDPSVSASVGFILQEVMPDYHRWSYAEIAEKDAIGTQMLNLIHLIMRNVKGVEKVTRNLAFEICCHELILGQARTTLLSFVSVGPGFLQTYTKTCPPWKEENDVTRAVALSLSILSQLLETLRLEPERSREAFLNDICSSSPDSPLIQIARYLLFKLDARFAKLSILVLKKLGQLLPSALLSCLGDYEAAFVDGFIARLESPLEEVQMKIYALEFLAVCAEFQFGLAEKLLQSNETTKGALECLWELLASEEQFPQILEAVYNLLRQFWMGKYAMAVDYLKKKKDFWLILCRPLLSGEQDFYPKLVGIALSLVAEELHWKGNSNEEISPDLKTLLTDKDIFGIPRIQLLFEKLQNMLTSRVGRAQKMETLTHFYSFSAMISKKTCKEGPDIETRKQWMKLQWSTFAYLCDTFGDNLEDSFPLLQCFGLMAATVTGNWDQAEVLSPSVDSLCRVMEVHAARCPVFLVAAAVEYLNPAMATFHNTSDLSQATCLQLFEAQSTLLEKLFTVLFNSTATKEAALKRVIRATTAMLCSLIALMKTLDSAQSFPILQQRAILRSTVVLLESYGVIPESQRADFKLAVAKFFTKCLDRTDATLLAIMDSGWCEYCCLELPTKLSHKLELANEHDKTVLLMQEVVQFHHKALKGSRHSFLNRAFDFAGSWSDILWKSLLNAVKSSSPLLDVTLAKIVAEFYAELAQYADKWRTAIRYNFSQTEECIVATTVKLISNLSHSTQSRWKKEEDAVTEAKLQKSCLELLCLCLQFLRVAWTKRYDERKDFWDFDLSPCGVGAKLLRSYSTNIGPEEFRLSFGALFQAVQLCISALRKSDTSLKSASPSSHRSFASLLGPPDRVVASMIFETCVVLILAQAVEILDSETASAEEKVILRREISSELGQMLVRCIRYGGGSPSGSRRSPALSPGTSSQLFNQDFLNASSLFIQGLAEQQQ